MDLQRRRREAAHVARPDIVEGLRRLGISRGEAGDYIKTYFQRFPGIRDYMEATKEIARKQGYVETLFGRRAHFADINSKMSSGTAVATITTSSQTDDYIYRAKFYPGSTWMGYLERYTLPYYDGKTADWEAGQLLKSRVDSSGHGDRKIYTYLNSLKQQFVSSNGDVKTELAGLW